MFFQNRVTAALNHKKIGKHPERIANTRLFINQRECKKTDFSSEVKDWKDFETNSKTIVHNVMFSPHKKEKIKQPYISKQNEELKNN